MSIQPRGAPKLRGFQRRVAEQSDRYAAHLTYGRQLAARAECGELTGVFSARIRADMRRVAYVVGLLPMAAIPVLIAGAAARVPGAVPMLAVLPFVTGAWFGLSMWRGRKPTRHVWFYAFTEGFLLVDDPPVDTSPVRWGQVSEVGEVWTNSFDPNAEENRPVLTAYRLRYAGGQTCEIPRAVRNVQDPYPNVGPLLKGMLPAAVGNTIPTFPTIDEIIQTYAGKPGQRR